MMLNSLRYLFLYRERKSKHRHDAISIRDCCVERETNDESIRSLQFDLIDDFDHTLNAIVFVEFQLDEQMIAIEKWNTEKFLMSDDDKNLLKCDVDKKF